MNEPTTKKKCDFPAGANCWPRSGYSEKKIFDFEREGRTYAKVDAFDDAAVVILDGPDDGDAACRGDGVVPYLQETKIIWITGTGNKWSMNNQELYVLQLQLRFIWNEKFNLWERTNLKTVFNPFELGRPFESRLDRPTLVVVTPLLVTLEIHSRLLPPSSQHDL